MRYIILLINVLLSQYALTQARIVDIVDPHFLNRNIWNDDGSIEGTPYFIDRWINGKVVTKFGKIFENVPLKYDAHLDQLNFRSEKGVILAIPDTKVDYFQFTDLETDKTYLFKHLPLQGYHMVLYEGENTLYKKIEKKIKKGLEDNGYNNASQTKDRVHEEITVLVYNKATDELLKVSNKKSLVEIFGEDVKKFIKENKIKIDNEDDLVRVVKFFDSKQNN